MIVLMIFGVIGVLVISLMHIPVRVFVEYREDVVLYLRVLFIRFDILNDKKPKQSMSVREYNRLERKRQKNSEKEKAKKSKKSEKEETDKKEEPEKKESSTEKAKKVLRLIREFSSLAVNVLKEFISELYVEIYSLNINVSCESVSDTALLYTGISQAMNMFFEAVKKSRHLKMHYDSIGCECDYLSGNFAAEIKISVGIRIGGAVRIAVYAMYNFLKIKIKERKKYGQQNQ